MVWALVAIIAVLLVALGLVVAHYLDSDRHHPHHHGRKHHRAASHGGQPALKHATATTTAAVGDDGDDGDDGDAEAAARHDGQVLVATLTTGERYELSLGHDYDDAEELLEDLLAGDADDFLAAKGGVYINAYQVNTVVLEAADWDKPRQVHNDFDDLDGWPQPH
jgi:hypothetical protein